MNVRPRLPTRRTILAFTLAALITATLWVTTPGPTANLKHETIKAWKETTGRVLTKTTTHITLGPPGGQAALDRCDGTWIELTRYQLQDLQPVYGAHNYCGGKSALAWKTGTTITIKNHGTYTVTDIRNINEKADLTELLGMDGTLILQTCYWWSNTMKFVALTPESAPVTETATRALPN